MKEWTKLEIEVLSFEEIEKTIVSASGSWCKTTSCCSWAEGGGSGACLIPQYFG